MPDEKISQLPSGDPAQTGDLIAIARIGTPNQSESVTAGTVASLMQKSLPNDYLFMPTEVIGGYRSGIIMGNQRNDQRLNTSLFRPLRFLNIASATLLLTVKSLISTERGYFGIYLASTFLPSPDGALLAQFKFDISVAPAKVIASPSPGLVLRPDTLYYCAIGTDEATATAQASGTIFDDSFMNVIGFLSNNSISGGQLPSTLGGANGVYNQSTPAIMLTGQ